MIDSAVNPVIRVTDIIFLLRIAALADGWFDSGTNDPLSNTKVTF